MYVPAHEREKANSLMSFCLCIGYTSSPSLSNRSALTVVWRWEVSCLLWFQHRLSIRIDVLYIYYTSSEDDLSMG